MSEQRPLKFKNMKDETYGDILVYKINTDFDLNDLTNSILKFARCTSFDQIELETCKGVKTGLTRLYHTEPTDLPIHIVHLKALG